MNNNEQTGSKGIRLLEAAMQEYGPIFTMQQIKPIARKQQLTDTHLRFLISSLASAGRIEIIKRGTYLVTSPLFTEDISPFALAAALVEPMAIGYWSACAYHGFTTQNPAMIQAATPKKVVTPEMRKGKAYRPRGRAVWQAYNLEFEFINVRPKYFWGFKEEWVSSWHQVNIMDPERTVLDLVARADLFGGMQAAMGVLENAINLINIRQLVEYVLRYDVVQVVKRLGWALESLGVPFEEIAELRQYPASGYYKIDTTQSSKNARVDERWNIIENLRRGY
ncbi:MAG: hypothetical protein K8R77_16200 [Anaerolineaceae bacterium]|nr:hypothetical protein [Anaerolineaceae bacterium]